MRRHSSGIQEEARRLHSAQKLQDLGFPLQKCLSALSRCDGNREQAAALLLQEKTEENARSRVSSEEDNAKPLIAMGFPRAWAMRALQESNGDTEVAARWILSNQSRLKAADASAASGEKIDPAVQTLIDMGFPREKCKLALKRCEGDIQQAVSLLARSSFQEERDSSPASEASHQKLRSPKRRPESSNVPLERKNREISAAEEFAVKIPAGCSPGQRLLVTSPSGQRIQVQVPANARAGIYMRVKVPQRRKSQEEKQKTVSTNEKPPLARPRKLSKQGRELLSKGMSPPPQQHQQQRTLSKEKLEELLEDSDRDSSSDSNPELNDFPSPRSSRTNWDPDVFKQLPQEMQKELLQQKKQQDEKQQDKRENLKQRLRTESHPPPSYEEISRNGKKLGPPPAYRAELMKGKEHPRSIVSQASFTAEEVALPAIPGSKPSPPPYINSTLDAVPEKATPEWYGWFESLDPAKQTQILELPEDKRRRLLDLRPTRRLRYLQASTAHDDDDDDSENSPEMHTMHLETLLRPVSGEGWSRRVAVPAADRRQRRKTEGRSRLDRILNRGKNMEKDNALALPDFAQSEEPFASTRQAKVSPTKSRSSRLWSSPIRFFKGQTEKQILIDKLGEYDEKLRDELQRRQALWEQLKETMVRAEDEARVESRRLLSWGIHDQEVFRTIERRQLLRMQRHAALQQLHHSAGALLAERAREVGSFVITLNASTSGGKGSVPLPVIGDEFFIDPGELISRDSGIRAKREFMANLAGRLREADKKVAKLRSQLLPFSHEKRKEIVQEMILVTVSAMVEEGDKAVPPEEAQVMFNSVVSDVRCPQGSLWTRWRDTFLSTLDPNVPEASYNPSGVVVFVDYFAEVLGYDFDVLDDDSHIAALHSLVEGLVYPELRPLCMKFNQAESQEMDRKWLKQLKWVRNLSMAEIGVAKKFTMSEKVWRQSFGNRKSFRLSSYYRITVEGGQSSPENTPPGSPGEQNDASPLPYRKACKHLTNFATGQVPGLMINSILLAVKAIHAEANRAVDKHRVVDKDKKSVPLTAEDLLPIMVWVAMHAKMPSVHSALAFVEQFGGRCNRGEAAYYLCSLQSAVQFITNMDESHIVDVDADVHSLSSSEHDDENAIVESAIVDGNTNISAHNDHSGEEEGTKTIQPPPVPPFRLSKKEDDENKVNTPRRTQSTVSVDLIDFGSSKEDDENKVNTPRRTQSTVSVDLIDFGSSTDDDANNLKDENQI
eukprot:g5228.t1